MSDFAGSELPMNFESWNPAMRGAYMNGRRAFASGQGLDSCPYRDIRKPNGRISWSRAFIRAWEDGWVDAKSKQEIQSASANS